MEHSGTNPQIPVALSPESSPVTNTTYCKHQPILYLIASLLIVVILSGVAYLYRTRNQPIAPQTTFTKTKVTPIPTTNSTTNWKIYNNDGYGLEFKYPASWETLEIDTSYYPKAKYWLKLDEKGESIPWASGMDTMFYPWRDHPIFAIRGINIIVTKDDSIEINREGYNCNLETEGCVFLFKFSPTIFNGIPARLTVAQFPDICADPENRASCGGDNEIIPYSYIAFKKDNYTWVISYDHSDFYQNHNPIYDQILSTFRFLAQPTPTTNPEGKFCGGIAANLPENQCPSGYHCQLDGNYPDASGKCVKTTNK